MSEETQAERLARWLEAHPGSEPPPDLDPEVVQAVYALRSDLAPAARVSLDDILGSVTKGPFAVPSTSEEDTTEPVAPIPLRLIASPPPEARPTTASPPAAGPTATDTGAPAKADGGTTRSTGAAASGDPKIVPLNPPTTASKSPGTPTAGSWSKVAPFVGLLMAAAAALAIIVPSREALLSQESPMAEAPASTGSAAPKRDRATEPAPSRDGGLTVQEVVSTEAAPAETPAPDAAGEPLGAEGVGVAGGRVDPSAADGAMATGAVGGPIDGLGDAQTGEDRADSSSTEADKEQAQVGAKDAKLADDRLTPPSVAPAAPPADPAMREEAPAGEALAKLERQQSAGGGSARNTGAAAALGDLATGSTSVMAPGPSAPAEQEAEPELAAKSKTAEKKASTTASASSTTSARAAANGAAELDRRSLADADDAPSSGEATRAVVAQKPASTPPPTTTASVPGSGDLAAWRARAWGLGSNASPLASRSTNELQSLLATGAPEAGEAAFALASSELAAQQFSQALTTVQAGLAVEGTSRSVRARLFALRGSIYERLGQTAQALASYQNAATLLGTASNLAPAPAQLDRDEH